MSGHVVVSGYEEYKWDLGEEEKCNSHVLSSLGLRVSMSRDVCERHEQDRSPPRAMSSNVGAGECGRSTRKAIPPVSDSRLTNMVLLD